MSSSFLLPPGGTNGTPDERRLVSDRTAFWITDILSDDEARAYIFGRGSDLEFPFPVAVKTGTSSAYHDNWTVGYTRDLTVGVWVGTFDRTPLRGSSGVTGAGPIFHAVMLAALARAAAGGAAGSTEPVLPVPAGLHQVTICALSGERANPWCPSRATEWLPAGIAGDDPPPCSWHHQSDDGLLTIYPPQYRAWARTEAGVGTTDVQAASAPVRLPSRPSRRAAPASLLAIANPPDGAVYPTLRREFQALPLRAVTAKPTTIRWSVDGAPIGTAPSDSALSWPLAVGSHRIEVQDADGRHAATSVIVR